MISFENINEAVALTKQGKYSEAEQIYLELLNENPNEHVLLSAFGLFYINCGNYDKAIDLLLKACNIKETLGTVSALGFAEFELRNYKNAASYLEKSLDFGNNPDIYNKLILSLFETKDYKKAIEYANKMFELYPKDYRAVANQVKSLTQQGKLLEAETLCVTKLKETPEVTCLWFHLGYLKELIYSDDTQAKECYKAASALGAKEADYNIAVSHMKLGEFEQAEYHYKKMLENFPNDTDTITSLGMCYLTQKKFKQGYELFFNRNKTELNKKTNNPWEPKDKLGENIVVMCDQGFGDHIQFIRYVPFLESKSIQVAAPKNLKKLFEQNYPKIEFIDYDSINPETQSIRISDLPYALDIDFDNIPFAEGYLDVPTKEIKNEKLKIGLCWEAGSAGIRTMINRTINIKCFEELLNLENIQIYSFQVKDTLNGNEKYPQMINLAKDFNDFYDTAQAIKSMDIMITVDTSVAHLSGALGAKTYLLLPYASDWRWFRDTKTTPWYDSVEIFKQTDSISWEEPIKNIIQILKRQK